MLLEAIYHRPRLNWCYAYDRETIHLRLRSKKNDLSEVFAYIGDKYAWEQTNELIPMKKLICDEMFDYWECSVKPPFRRLKYGFLLQSGHEQHWMSEDEFTITRPTTPNRLFEYPYLNPSDIFIVPDWVKDATFYQIFPERFANGDPHNDPAGVLPWGGKPERDNFFGGDLQGVIHHLDHLSELGITAIYFTPVFTATTNHKYDTTDYMTIDPHFGDVETMKQLVIACHERGIRILLDAVFNHSGKKFAPFVDVLDKGEHSVYRDWFHIHKFPLNVVDGIPTYDTFSFDPIMPKLNTGNPEVRDYLLQVAHFWIKEVGIDGWRLDVANEVDHQFWREFRKVVKQANPEAYILGEVWNESSNWLQGDQFDAVMNYPFTDAVLDFIANGTLDAQGFAHAIGKQLSRYPQQASEVAFNLLDSHDTPRLLTVCEGNKNKMKLASMLLFTYSGTPCIYYGSEIGLDGGQDPDSRKCMEWDETLQDRDLFNFYQRLISLRKELPALRTGSLQFLLAEESATKLAFKRQLGDETVLVLLNNDNSAQTIELVVEQCMWLNTNNDITIEAKGNTLSVHLPAYGYAILTAIK
ncbi:alpha-glycosidase [Paenibacillus anaericanus]|uniref:Alpha-amylase n=1 Tax=Paenibacillus anaericanus TaxID=170367 RepID=A0A3S1ELX6_9BACL|nr:alpha-glycosidase [Paenibacillus anaericanus]RUT48377.1 alpha-glycosidase [Paenibacillus anaericanus]